MLENAEKKLYFHVFIIFRYENKIKTCLYFTDECQYINVNILMRYSFKFSI